MIWFGITALVLGIGLGLVLWQVRRRHMQRWLPTYLRETGRRRAPGPDEEIHLLLCFADHYEPKMDGADRARGLRRVQTWADTFPRQFGRFRDSDGRPP